MLLLYIYRSLNFSAEHIKSDFVNTDKLNIAKAFCRISNVYAEFHIVMSYVFVVLKYNATFNLNSKIRSYFIFKLFGKSKV